MDNNSVGESPAFEGGKNAEGVLERKRLQVPDCAAFILSEIQIEVDIMASIKDVANRAGVGVATVSRMLNDSGYVSDETRERILESIDALNYKPNDLARQLYRKKAGLIAVILPDNSHPFFAALSKEIEHELYANGYKTMLCNAAQERNSEQEYLDMLDRHIVDGIITGVHTLDVDSYLRIKKPIVAFDRDLGDHIPVVRVDHNEGGRLAAELLVREGCRNVIQFQGAKSVSSPSHARHEVFERIMHENGVKIEGIELKWNQFDPEYFRQITQQVFDEHPGIDGVFGADLLVAYFLKAAMNRGLRSPEDLKVVAYDGTFVTQVFQPSITSIVQPVRELAGELVRKLCQMIAGKDVEHETILNVSVREGQTT